MVTGDEAGEGAEGCGLVFRALADAVGLGRAEFVRIDAPYLNALIRAFCLECESWIRVCAAAPVIKCKVHGHGWIRDPEHKPIRSYRWNMSPRSRIKRIGHCHPALPLATGIRSHCAVGWSSAWRKSRDELVDVDDGEFVGLCGRVVLDLPCFPILITDLIWYIKTGYLCVRNDQS